MWAGPG
jgi:hypothetical protein